MRLMEHCSRSRTSFTSSLRVINWRSSRAIWDATITGQSRPLEEDEVLRPLILRQLRQSTRLKEELMHFERAEPDSDTKTYTFLYNCLSQRIELNRQSNSRPARIAIRGKEHPTKPCAPGPKAKADGRGKTRGISKGRTVGAETPRRTDQAARRAVTQLQLTHASHIGKQASAPRDGMPLRALKMPGYRRKAYSER